MTKNRSDVAAGNPVLPEADKACRAETAPKLGKGGFIHRTRESLLVVLTAACLLGASLPSMAGNNGDFAQPVITGPAEDGWEFFFQLDGYLPWVEIEMPSGTEVDLAAEDILDTLQMTAQFTVGARKGKWGVAAHVIYVDLAGNPSGSTVNKLELEEWLVTPLISYRAYEGEKGFLEFVAGARYTWVDINVEGVTPITGTFFKEGGKADIWDALVGINGDYRIDEKWHVPYYAEVGTGDSDFITQAWAGIGYRINPCFDLGLLFRVVYYDFGDSAPMDTEFVYGPQMYLRYTF